MAGTAVANSSTRSRGRPGLLQGVQPAVDHLADAGQQRVQPPRGEGRRQQPPQPGVVGRIAEAQAARVGQAELLGVVPTGGQQVGEVVAERRGVAEHPPDVGVPGDQPDGVAEEVEPADRLLLAPPSQLRDRVQAGAEQGHEEGVRFHRAPSAGRGIWSPRPYRRASAAPWSGDVD